MVSMDPPERNRAFAESLGSRVSLLSDPTGQAARAFGVVNERRSVPERWTFYIDAGGVITKIDRSVEPETAGEDMLENLDRLGLGEPAPQPAGQP